MSQVANQSAVEFDLNATIDNYKKKFAGKVSPEELSQNIEAIKAAALSPTYTAKADIVSAIFYLRCNVALTDGSASFSGDAGGAFTPGGGAGVGLVTTHNLEDLLSKTTAWASSVAGTGWRIDFLNGSTWLGQFVATGVSTVVGTGGGSGSWSTGQPNKNNPSFDVGQIKYENTQSGKVEVGVETFGSGYKNTQPEKQSTFGCENNGYWSLVDFEGTGKRRDLAYIKTRNTGSGKVEVHVASYSSGYQTIICAQPTNFPQSMAGNGTWSLVDYEGNGKQRDLAYIQNVNTSEGNVEVFIANYDNGEYPGYAGFDSGFKCEDNGSWSLANYHGTGKQWDLVYIKTQNTGSGFIEVFVADGSDNWKKVTVALPSVIPVGDGPNGTWSMVDFDGSGKANDLGFVKEHNTGSGMLEVHVASHASAFKSYIWHQATQYKYQDYSSWSLIDYSNL